MRFTRPFLMLSLALLPVVTTGCEDEDPEPRRSITITGGVENRTGEALPEDASIVVVWALDDDSYVAGVGTFEPDGEGFRVVLPAPPPEGALLGGAVGIGFIAAIDGPAPVEGTPLDEDAAIGLVDNHAIIYVADRGAVPAGALWWLADMPDGYSLGIGVERDDEVFEGFEPVPAGSADMIIDDLENLHVVNWS